MILLRGGRLNISRVRVVAIALESGIVMPGREKIELPPRPFFYTLDQVATLLSMSENHLKSTMVFYQGRSVGVAKSDMLKARSIAKVDEPPDWRISEAELLRWLRARGFRVYERARISAS